MAGSGSGSGSRQAKTGFGGGFLSLEQSMSDPLLQVYRDSEFVCIRDKYPKSRVHLLLIPLLAATSGTRLLKVEQLLDLPEPVDFLERCRDVANDVVASKVCPCKAEDDVYPKASDLIIGEQKLFLALISERG